MTKKEIREYWQEYYKKRKRDPAKLDKIKEQWRKASKHYRDAKKEGKNKELRSEING